MLNALSENGQEVKSNSDNRYCIIYSFFREYREQYPEVGAEFLLALDDFLKLILEDVKEYLQHSGATQTEDIIFLTQFYVAVFHGRLSLYRVDSYSFGEERICATVKEVFLLIRKGLLIK